MDNAQGRSDDAAKENEWACLFIGAGCFGNNLARSLTANSKYYTDLNKIDYKCCGSSSRLDVHAHFTDAVHFLKKADIIFLAGSLDDESFRHTREAVLSSSADFIFTLGLIPENSKTKCIKAKPEKNECLIPLQPETTISETELLIRDIYYTVCAPNNLICTDSADVRSLCGGRIAMSQSIELDERQTNSYVDRFRRFMKMSAFDVRTANAIMTAVLYNERNQKLCESIRMEDIEKIATYLEENCNANARILFSAKVVRSLNTDMRFRLLMTYKPETYNFFTLTKKRMNENS